MLPKGSFYEYSLYASIILLSGMGVASLPSYLDESPVSPVNTYTASMYLAFLTWAFHELHRLHSKKRAEQPASGPILVKDSASVIEQTYHEGDAKQAWMERLSWMQCATVRLLVALGGKIRAIEAPLRVAELPVALDSKEKPEAA